MSVSHQTSSYPPDPYPPLDGTAISATLMGESVSKPIPTSAKPGLRIFYASAHDILSYPCEDGNPELVRDASVSLPHGSHGQWIENVHLETYESEREFWVGRDAEDEGVYKRTFGKLLRSAEGFVRRTRSMNTPSDQAQAGQDEDDVIIFVSCGFDASEYEYPSMSRHGRHVPASFYYRFAKDVRALADRHARGRVVSVLEGGYSDRALIAGGMAWLTGLAGYEPPLDKNNLGTPKGNEVAVAVNRFTGKLDDAIPIKEWIARTGPRDWWALGNVEKVSHIETSSDLRELACNSFGGNNPTLQNRRGSLWWLYSSQRAFQEGVVLFPCLARGTRFQSFNLSACGLTVYRCETGKGVMHPFSAHTRAARQGLACANIIWACLICHCGVCDCKRNLH